MLLMNITPKSPSRILNRDGVWHILVLCTIFGCMMLLGCDRKQGPNSTNPTTNQLAIQLPEPLRKADPSGEAFTIKVVVDKGTLQEMVLDLQNLAFNDGIVTGTLTGLPPGPHSFELQYFYGDSKILVATLASDTTEVIAGETQPVNFNPTFVLPDDDDDGYTNLAEVTSGTRWDDPNSKPVPSVPKNVKGESLNRNIKLTWSPAHDHDALSYKIYMAADESITIATYNQLVAGMDHRVQSTEFVHPNPLANGTTYYFLVTAENEQGEGEVSTKVAVTPQLLKPIVRQQFQGNALCNSVHLTWNASNDVETYIIYMATEANVTEENYSMRDDVIGSITEFYPSELKKGQTYYFIITAQNQSGVSARTEPINITIPTTCPTTTVPDVIGQSKTDAITKLEAAKLIVDTAVDIHPDAIRTLGSVVALSEKAGNVIKAEDVVDENTVIKLTLAIPPDPGVFLTHPNEAPKGAGNAEAYYKAIDPNDEKTTFEAWRALNGYKDFATYDANVMYFNHADHNFARRIGMQAGENGTIAFYGNHFPDLVNATQEINLLETVAIEYGPALAPDADSAPVGNYVKFYAFDQEGNRVTQVNIDEFDQHFKRLKRPIDTSIDDNNVVYGNGPESVPDVCIVCHGGKSKRLIDGVYPNQGNTNSRLIPFDLSTFTFVENDLNFSRTIQETGFRTLNQAVMDSFGTLLSGGTQVLSKDDDPELMIPDFCESAAGSGEEGCINGQPRSVVAEISIDTNIESVGDVNVVLDDITHERVGDLRFVLESPKGTKVLLMDGRGGAATQITDLRLHDEATISVAKISGETLTDIWKPEITLPKSSRTPFDANLKLRLAHFDKENPNGNWKLIVTDQVSSKIGTLDKWSLHFTFFDDEPQVKKLIKSWYENDGNKLSGSFITPTPETPMPVPAGWQIPYAPISAAQLYREVIAPSCRVCHLQRTDDGSGRGFATFDQFIGWRPEIEALVFNRGTMPRALPTFNNFWSSDNQPQLLATFLDNIDPHNLTTPVLPIADAGTNRVVLMNNPVLLDASSSLFTDDDQTAHRYIWEFISSPEGSGVSEVSNPNESQPSFTPDIPGKYVVKLTVENTVTSKNHSTEIRIDAIETLETLNFSQHIVPILQDPVLCAKCHSLDPLVGRWLVFRVDGTFESIYTELTKDPSTANENKVRIDKAEPANSLVLTKPSNLHPASHGGGLLPGFELGNERNDYHYKVIEEWIIDEGNS